MSRPLCSAPITGTSPLLRADPPADTATVLNASRLPPLDALPVATPNLPEQPYRHLPSHVPCTSRRPGSRRLHTGHRLASKRAPARLLPTPKICAGLDVISSVSMPRQRFTHVRLPDPHLTRHSGPFPHALSLSTSRYSPDQHPEVV